MRLLESGRILFLCTIVLRRGIPMTKTYSKTRILVEGALMIALSTVLSMIQIPLMPHGGSITLFSMVPILVMSYRHGAK